jgi:hypothetical protein
MPASLSRGGASFWRTPFVLVPTIFIDETTVPTVANMRSEPWLEALAAAQDAETSEPLRLMSPFGSQLEVARGRSSVFFYQRVNASGDNFCPDYALEAGAYLCFLDDWYDDLPQVTVFLHQLPSAHNELMAEWVNLLRHDLTYTTLVPEYLEGRNTETWAGLNASAWVEQCYRDFLKLGGVHAPKRQRVGMSGWHASPAPAPTRVRSTHSCRDSTELCSAAPQVLLHRVRRQPWDHPPARPLGVRRDASAAAA